MQLVYDQLPGYLQERVEVNNKLIAAARNINRLTADWYAFEYRYISEELAESLLVLAQEINKLVVKEE